MGSAVIRNKKGEIVGFVHGEKLKACSECGIIADNLCDFPIGNNKTCDALLCDMHAHPIAENKHLCPIHSAIFKTNKVIEPISLNRIELLK